MKPRRGSPSARRTMARGGALAAALLLASIVIMPAPAAPLDELVPVRPAPPPWAEELKAFDGSPMALAYLVENRQFHGGTFLVTGARPKDDRPAEGHPLLGKLSKGDWVLEDGTAAIRVTDLPAPEAGQPIVLAARLAPEPEPALRGVRTALAGKIRGRTLVRVGDLVHFPLPSTKSYSCHVEFSGEVASIESLGFLTGLVLKAVRPGSVTGKVFAQWWNRPDPELLGEFTVEVRPPVDAAPTPRR